MGENQKHVLGGKRAREASYRDAALRHIIEFSMAASDIEASGTLLTGIQSEPILDELFLAYPALFR